MPQDTSVGNSNRKLPEFVSVFLVAVGSNRVSVAGAPDKTVHEALSELENRGVVIRAKSTVFRTPAYPAGSGQDFANAVVECSVKDCTVHEVLNRLHAVEEHFGRTRNERWGPRTLDLDLLSFDDAILPDKETLKHWIDLPPELQAQTAPRELLLPHPRIQDRAFVLVPLVQIAPNWIHPVLETTAQEMLARLPEYMRDEVRPYDP